jgi:hypothetical protein
MIKKNIEKCLMTWIKNCEKLNKKGKPKNKYIASFFDDNIKLNVSNNDMKILPIFNNK